jgi:hypothetical protein
MRAYPLGDRRYRQWKAGILRRDAFRCVVCGAQGPATELHVDHRTPRQSGGALMDPRNVRVLCRACNLVKGARTMSDDELRRRRGLAPPPITSGLGPLLVRGGTKRPAPTQPPARKGTGGLGPILFRGPRKP